MTKSICLAFAIVAFLAAATLQLPAAQTAPPNVVWVIVEDMSAHFGCYGETSIETPNVDRMAAQGVRFTNAIVTAPVCSTCRSALVTGMFQTSIGAHHHRSGRGRLKIELPPHVAPVPKLFQDAGYHVNNLSTEEFLRSADDVKARPNSKLAKTDYNFEWNRSIYAKTHWAARKPGQPFFCQIQPRGGKLRGKGAGPKWPKRVRKILGQRTPVSAVRLPPYLPNDPVIVEDWAQYLDTVRYADWELGQIMARLKASGDLENTYIFFITDHGLSHVRNKQFCYEGGAHIPLIIYGPKLDPQVRDDVVQHIDLAATSMALAGIKIPPAMQARNILADDYQVREFAFSARDRCDETLDRIRCVRSKRYKYIRNCLPERPYLQPNRYKDGKPIVQAMRRLHEQGKLNAAQAKIMASSRPIDELYDLEADPFELTNLANDATHANRLAKMQAALDDWIENTGDLGQRPEGAMYDSDMAVYSGKGKGAEQAQILKRNIALMKKWEAQGK